MPNQDRPKNTVQCPRCGHAIPAGKGPLSGWTPKEVLIGCPKCREMSLIPGKLLAAARGDFFHDYVLTPAIYFAFALAIGGGLFWIFLRSLTPS